MTIERRYGWRPPLPNPEARKYSAVLRDASNPLPPKVDLSTSQFMPPISDQQNLGACTAFATCAAFDYLNAQEGKGFLGPSRLFQYYNTRMIEGHESADTGASIADSIKSVNTYGECPESIWPYDTSKFAVKPTAECYTEAASHEVADYLQVDNTDLVALKTCLADGFPIVFGATLYQSFESQTVATTGIVPMPEGRERILGGHAQVIVGYDDTVGRFLVRNSWGVGWGIHGYEWFPYAYISNPNLAADFWTLRKLAAPVQVGEVHWRDILAAVSTP